MEGKPNDVKARRPKQGRTSAKGPSPQAKRTQPAAPEKGVDKSPATSPSLSIWPEPGAQTGKAKSPDPGKSAKEATNSTEGSSAKEKSIIDESLEEIIARANKGDKEAVKALRQILDERSDIWRTAGNMSRYSEAIWIEMISRGNALMAESSIRMLAQKKEELLGANPVAIEVALVDQVLVCWLECQYYQMQADAPAGKIELETLRLKRLESAQKRYFSGLKQLVQMRALMPQGMVPLRRCTLHRNATA